MVPAGRSSRLPSRSSLILLPLGAFLLLFAWLIVLTIPKFGGPSGAGYGADFSVFYEASKVQQAGQNPYDADLLWSTERTDFVQAHLRPPQERALVRVGNPPLFFWALKPLAALPFRLAGILWTLLMYACSLAGLLVLLRWLGWRRHVFPAAFFLATPQVALGAFYGDLIGLVFLAVSLAVVCARKFPALAGALLAVCWFKPHVALPIALLVWLFYARKQRTMALAFVASSTALAGVMLLAVGFHGVESWLDGAGGWTHSIRGQPEMASAAGLYYLWASPAVRNVLSVVLLLAALAATLLTWRRFHLQRLDPVKAAWLWALWLVCLPYAHINDAMLLTLPVLVLLGKDGEHLLSKRSMLTLYLLCSCAVLKRLPGLPIELEPLKLTAIILVLGYQAGDAFWLPVVNFVNGRKLVRTAVASLHS